MKTEVRKEKKKEKKKKIVLSSPGINYGRKQYNEQWTMNFVLAVSNFFVCFFFRPSPGVRKDFGPLKKNFPIPSDHSKKMPHPPQANGPLLVKNDSSLLILEYSLSLITDGVIRIKEFIDAPLYDVLSGLQTLLWTDHHFSSIITRSSDWLPRLTDS